MSAHLTPDELESLALSNGEPGTHVQSCPDCARELAWLRAERALFARRAAPATDSLWAGVERRIAAAPAADVLPLRRPASVRRIGFGAAVGLSAAAALLLVIQRPVRGPAPDAAVADDSDPDAVDPKALAALDRAEGEVQRAATVLEAEYRAMRAQLDPAEAQKVDASIAKARAQLGSAQKVASLDVQARVRVIDSYSGYLRSLRDVVASTDVHQ